MQVYKIEVYDRYGRQVYMDYKMCTDRQQAEILAEAICADWDATEYEIDRIR